MRIVFTLLLSCLAMHLTADERQLDGFLYDHPTAPDGTEWQSPMCLALNKEQPRAYLFSFASTAEALQVLPEASSLYESLDGVWKFHWVATPEERPVDFYKPAYDVSAWDDIQVPGCWNVQGLRKDGSMKYGVPIYVNQPVIFYHQVREGDWKEGVMREPRNHDWTTYKYRNEVGSYRRTFTLPGQWNGKRVYINFDGVDSFFYLWVNGRYVGFSKNSRNTARFDITDCLQRGENMVAVEVYRNSDGSFLEAQDMFRLPGIFRSTYLTAQDEVQISDLAIRTQQMQGNRAILTIDASVRNLGGKEQPDLHADYSIYPVGLYSDSITSTSPVREVQGGYADVPTGGCNSWHQTFGMTDIRPWSAEQPYRYVLVAELKNRKGEVVDRTSTYFGVRTVEILDTKADEDEFGKAGRYFYVNGKTVKLKGVNRHENNPSTGHAITHEQMLREVMLMKQANINHVRLSHYSNDPYWYYLADKYGLYLEDECNLESHEYYYGQASLSHPIEWRPAHVARNMEMVKAHINHPSIVIWSLGNEAGPGDNFKAAYEAIKQYDCSRPVQYERNNDIVDMGSNQYPSVDWVRWVAQGGDTGVKYPFHISEFAHSMGNSLGDFADYWKAMESTDYFCGGAIWDWVDQAIDTYKPDGTRFLGYGGDHGDTPNDGMFCMNGIMLPDLQPKPQYYEVKKVYQNIGVSLREIKDTQKEGRKAVSLNIFNKNYFLPLDYCDMYFKVLRDGQVVRESTKGQPVLKDTGFLQPRDSLGYFVPVDMKEPGEYFLNVEFRLSKDMPWAEAGYVQMEEQLPLGIVGEWRTIAEDNQEGTLKQTTEGNTTVIKGGSFQVSFDGQTGAISSYRYNGEEMFQPGGGPQLDALRAPVDNDNWYYTQWYQKGLHDLVSKATRSGIRSNSDGSISLSYDITTQGLRKGTIHGGSSGRYSIEEGEEMKPEDFHFSTQQIYTVYPDGSVELESSIVSSDANVALPRLGYVMKLPAGLQQYTYYGRGPLNNYNDRKTGSFLAQYQSTVGEQFVNFPKPQSMGNREDVRWCALTQENGQGLQFISTQQPLSASALPWSALQMTLAPHPCDLPQSECTWLHLDCKVTGLGGNSCGQGGPYEEDQVKGAIHQMGFIIRPVNAATSLRENARVKGATALPLAISRDKRGTVSILAQPGQTVLFTTGGRVQTYREPFDLRGGGTVTAYYKNQPDIRSVQQFQRLESIPVEVVYCSSEMVDDDATADKLVDGDANTIWHTVYGRTVNSYPHWVDFDCGEQKLIKGFTYLPRQAGTNGDIKDYKLELSDDGKNWSEPVARGTFGNDKKEQRVMLAAPRKARYIRFTALSSQNGADYASGAEFTVIAE